MHWQQFIAPHAGLHKPYTVGAVCRFPSPLLAQLPMMPLVPTIGWMPQRLAQCDRAAMRAWRNAPKASHRVHILPANGRREGRCADCQSPLMQTVTVL